MCNEAYMPKTSSIRPSASMQRVTDRQRTYRANIASRGKKNIIDPQYDR